MQKILNPEIPTSLMDKLKKLPELAELANFVPNIVKKAPCQQIIHQGQDASLDILPI